MLPCLGAVCLVVPKGRRRNRAEAEEHQEECAPGLGHTLRKCHGGSRLGRARDLFRDYKRQGLKDSLKAVRILLNKVYIKKLI